MDVALHCAQALFVAPVQSCPVASFFGVLVQQNQFTRYGAHATILKIADQFPHRARIELLSCIPKDDYLTRRLLDAAVQGRRFAAVDGRMEHLYSLAAVLLHHEIRAVDRAVQRYDNLQFVLRVVELQAVSDLCLDVLPFVVRRYQQGYRGFPMTFADRLPPNPAQYPEQRRIADIDIENKSEGEPEDRFSHHKLVWVNSSRALGFLRPKCPTST